MMSIFKKKWSAIVASAICILMMLFAVPAFADDELDPDTKASAEYLATAFLTEVYDLPDDQLESLRANGDFYNTLVDAVKDNEEDLGKLVSINSAEAKMGKNDHIDCVINATFEKNDANMTLYMLNDEQLTPTHYQVSVDYSLGDKLKQAAGNTVLSIVIVFILLLFLAFIISLFRFLNFGARAKQAEKVEKQFEERHRKEAEAEAHANAPARSGPAAASVSQDEIAAVIAAAIAAAEAEGTGDGYVVRSVRKIGTVRKWNRA